MNIGGLWLGALSDSDRADLLARARISTTTYDHVGSTLDPARWEGAAVHVQAVDVGVGPVAFDAAREALRTWVAQRGIGAEVVPPECRVAVDETLVIVLRRGPLYVLAPDRVVAVIYEPRRFAFAYGTLAGHPERGEESFEVARLADETVRVTIRVQAGPGTLAAQLVAPVVRVLQRAALRGYLKAISQYVAAAVAAHDPKEVQ